MKSPIIGAVAMALALTGCTRAATSAGQTLPVPAPITVAPPATTAAAPVTPSPAPVTPAPVITPAPAPVTPAPVVTPAPAPVTPAPEPAPTPEPDSIGDYYATPQFGAEPVRGSGCGANGSIGNEIPDGWWYGRTYDWTDTSFNFDLACVYFGSSADPFIKECEENSGSSCIDAEHDRTRDFWVEDNSSRKRLVHISPDFTTAYHQKPGVSCENDPRVEWPEISLIHIYENQAVSLLTICPLPGG